MFVLLELIVQMAIDWIRDIAVDILGRRGDAALDSFVQRLRFPRWSIKRRSRMKKAKRRSSKK